jgi:hypothetical protein
VLIMKKTLKKTERCKGCTHDMCTCNYNCNYNFWEEMGGNIVVLTFVIMKSSSGKTGIS